LKHCKASWTLGIDEAGRGSLVGEMIVAGYAIRSDHEDILQEIGVRDSKELTARARARIYKELTGYGILMVYPVRPSAIDRYNLNRLTTIAVIDIAMRVRKILGSLSCFKSIIIDKYGSPRGLTTRLRRMGFKGLLVVEEQADSKYPIVSAASIVAKHIRDTRIAVLSKLYGVRGSGYPSDPETIKWIRNVLSSGERPYYIRYSWSTLKEYGFGKKRRGKSLLDFL